MNNMSVLSKLDQAIGEVLRVDNMVNGQMIRYEDQTYNLEATDGAYDRGANLFLHHLMYREGVYELFLGKKELGLIRDMLSEDGIYRSSNTELMGLLDDLYSRGADKIKDFLSHL